MAIICPEAKVNTFRLRLLSEEQSEQRDKGEKRNHISEAGSVIMQAYFYY